VRLLGTWQAASSAQQTHTVRPISGDWLETTGTSGLPREFSSATKLHSHALEGEAMKAWKWIALASLAAGSACGDTAAPSSGSNPETLTDEAEMLGRKCEGRHNLECAAGQFCATSKKSKRCPDSETKGVCRYMPDVCTQIEEPVCGCDGQTYGNACQADMTGIALAYEGPCAPFCGGFAGIPCPGAGACVDNPSDSCDPAQGDVDCASLCRCEVQGLCNEGSHWDDSPDICGCVED
jgi:Kazal-type serine protease inhibitor-like protein